MLGNILPFFYQLFKKNIIREIVKTNLYLFAVLFWLLSFQVSAQTTQWDSTYRPDIYQSQVELFRSFLHSEKDIVFLGNSITFWGEWPEMLQSPHVKNRGIPGDITFGVLERLDEVISGKPAKVFILIGINDIARHIPDTVIVNNYQKIVRRLKRGSPATKIYFQTLLPTNSSFSKLKSHYNHEMHIQYINNALKQLAEKEQITVIDLYSHFADNQGVLPASLTFDGVHLTKAGYEKWVNILKSGKYIR